MPTNVRFDDLPDAGGGLRHVGPQVMDREQFEVEEWRITGVWTSEHPHRPGCTAKPMEVAYWEPSIGGIRRYAALIRKRREERRLAYRTRQEKDDEWTRHVESLVDGRDG